MRIRLRWVALVILILGFSVWGFSGFHWGWSKSTVTEMKMDEITGLEYPVKANTMVFGLELLGLFVLIAFICFGASFAFKKNKNILT